MQPNRSEELRTIYNCSSDELPLHAARYERLCALYRLNFPGDEPAFIVRAPGRVNLIGEHTDYNGYPVMPMAIDRDTVFVAAPRNDCTVSVINEHPSFERRTFEVRSPVPPSEQGDWGNYVKAAVHGLLEDGWVEANNAFGFQAVVGGTIPESAGLSSSSALVVASALAFLAANKKEINKHRLAELLARAERYVGSEGGGMDQAISLLAEAGTALKIDFFPLRTRPVALPEELSFVVCNSLVRAPKSEHIRYSYNRRVIECRLATALAAKALQDRTQKALQPTRLADLSGEKIGLAQNTVDKIVSQAIGENPVTLKTVAELLGESTDVVAKRYCSLHDRSVLAEPPDGFKAWNRYKHVVSEAHRVELTAKAFELGDSNAVGRLLNESHASCRDDFEISCPELEALVAIGREQGALGARLTGAGFGGCTVNAVPTDRVAEFVERVSAEYYHGYLAKQEDQHIAAYAELRDVIFVCRATAGAGVWPNKGGY